VADVARGFGQAGEAAAVGQLGVAAAPKRFGGGVVVAVAAPAPALLGPVAGKQLLKAGGRGLAAPVRMHDEPGRGRRRARARRRASLTRTLGVVSRRSYVPPRRHQSRRFCASSGPASAEQGFFYHVERLLGPFETGPQRAPRGHGLPPRCPPRPRVAPAASGKAAGACPIARRRIAGGGFPRPDAAPRP